MTLLSRRSLQLGSLARGALSVLTLALASSASAEIPPLTDPNRNTDGIIVEAHEIQEVLPAIENGQPRWKGTLLDITMKPSAIWEKIHTLVYLPAGYTATAAADAPGYDTLYLLHGAGGSAFDWSGSGDVGRTVDASSFKGIVIMAEGGRAGWYTNWVSRDLRNHQFNWQSFHLDQLRGWIDNHFRTNKARSARAIAGLSMGGHGALSYAAQRPELFSKAASFSGPGDIEDASVQQLVIANEVTKFAGTVPMFGSAIYKNEESDLLKRAFDVTLVIGPYSAWRHKNPYKLGAKYASNGIKVSLYSGYGGTSNVADSTLEYLAGLANDKLFAQLKRDGVQVRYCTGVGDHSMTYWRADLKEWLEVAYGPGSTSCPNGWGAPRP